MIAYIFPVCGYSVLVKIPGANDPKPGVLETQTKTTAPTKEVV
jgi:hypothetical protein